MEQHLYKKNWLSMLNFNSVNISTEDNELLLHLDIHGEDEINFLSTGVPFKLPVLLSAPKLSLVTT
jgi:hypothetical protein